MFSRGIRAGGWTWRYREPPFAGRGERAALQSRFQRLRRGRGHSLRQTSAAENHAARRCRRRRANRATPPAGPGAPPPSLHQRKALISGAVRLSARGLHRCARAFGARPTARCCPGSPDRRNAGCCPERHRRRTIPSIGRAVGGGPPGPSATLCAPDKGVHGANRRGTASGVTPRPTAMRRRRRFADSSHGQPCSALRRAPPGLAVPIRRRGERRLAVRALPHALTGWAA